MRSVFREEIFRNQLDARHPPAEVLAVPELRTFARNAAIEG